MLNKSQVYVKPHNIYVNTNVNSIRIKYPTMSICLNKNDMLNYICVI